MTRELQTSIGPKARRAEEARLSRLCRSIHKHKAGRLLPHRRPHADQVFAAVQSDEGLTSEQVGLLNHCYVLEGRLEHASPDVSAEEVREAVERLRGGLSSLITSAIAWLGSYGVSLSDRGCITPAARCR